jgi:hypothetical protein
MGVSTMPSLDLLADLSAPRIPFRGRDRYSLSDERPCLRWTSGQTLELAFSLKAPPAPDRQPVVALAAMPEIFDSHAYVHKFLNAILRIELNGETVFSGMVHWRSHEETASFWTAFRFPLSPAALRLGANSLRLTNLTRRDTLGEFYDPQLDREFDPAVAEAKLATIYLSHVSLESDPLPQPDTHLAGVPASAVAGACFCLDLVHGGAPMPVTITRQENADVLLFKTEQEFGRHRTPIHVTPREPGRPVDLAFETGGCVLECRIPLVYERRRDRGLRIGGGMETVYWHDIPQALTDSFAREHGNTFRISIDDYLNNLHVIPPDRWIPILNYLVRRRCHVALQRLRVPPYTRIQHADLLRLAELCGDWFAGVSIPEPVLHLGTPNRDKDLAHVLAEYLAFFRQRLEELRLPGRPIVTFDSAGGLAGHYYAAGLDVHLAEVGPACNAYEESCCRGAASAHGKPWGLVAAMLWYYGQGAQYACDDGRARLARLIAQSAYLAGAAQILWEGGTFDNLPAYNYVLSPESWRDYERRLDHPALVRIRDNMRDLLAFDRAQQLPPPTVHYGLIQGVNDIHQGRYTNAQSAFGDMALARSWELLSVFMPHVGTGRGPVPHDRPTRRWFSWTPYGQVDVVPASGPENRFQPYRLLVLAGWNTMTPALHRDLLAFVRAGGTLFLSLPHFAVDTNPTLEWRFFNQGDLSELAGIRVAGLGPRLSSVRFQSDLARGTMPEVFELAPKNPLFPEDFDEPYAVFSQDITYFSGALTLAGARVHAVSDQGVPAVLEHQVGAGRVILINTWFHPGRGRQLALARGLLRAVVEALPADLAMTDPTERVAWFEYQEAGFRRWFFLNTDWSRADACSAITVRLGPHTLPLEVRHPDPVQLLWNGSSALAITDPRIQIRRWEQAGATSRLLLHGGTAEAVRLLAGPAPEIRNG